MNYQRKRVAKRLASGLLAGALALGGLAISGGTASAVTPSSPAANRIAGADRYSTATALASAWIAGGGTPTNVVVASGENYPDALAAATLAGAKNAPIVLTRSGELPSGVRDWFLINRVAIANVFIVGGTSAVSDDVKTAISAVLEAADTVTRVSGATRYDTMKAISEVTGVLDGSDNLLLVSGENYADALAVANWAAAKGYPIVLTPSGSLGAQAAAVVGAWLAKPATGEIIIVGGTSAVSDSVKSALVEGGVPFSKIRRIAGTTRYGTSAAFNTYILGTGEATMVGQRAALVRGDDFADALAAAPFLALNKSLGGNNAKIHAVLTSGSSLSAEAGALVGTLATLRAGAATNTATNQLQELYVIGGTSAVSEDVKTAAATNAASTNLTPTITCPEGSTTITLTFPAPLTANDAALVAGDFTINGVSGGVTATGAGATADVKTATAGAALVAGSVINFLGKAETGGRKLLAASCTVADDATKPTLTIDYRTGASTFVVESSEPLAADITLAQMAFTGTALGAAPSADTVITANATKTRFVVTLNSAPATPVVITAGSIVTIATGATGPKDVAGNELAASATATSAATAEVVAPTIASVATVCAQDSEARVDLDGGNLRIEAAEAALPGIDGNGYTFTLVNKRGQLMPTVAYDAATKTYVLTVDKLFHTTTDVAVALRESGIAAAWVLKSSAGAAVVDSALDQAADFDTTPNKTAGGDQTCVITATASEPIRAAATISGVNIGGIAASIVAAGAGSATANSTLGGTTIVAQINDLVANPTGSIMLTVGSMTDLKGNNATVTSYAG